MQAFFFFFIFTLRDLRVLLFGHDVNSAIISKSIERNVDRSGFARTPRRSRKHFSGNLPPAPTTNY